MGSALYSFINLSSESSLERFWSEAPGYTKSAATQGHAASQ